MKPIRIAVTLSAIAASGVLMHAQSIANAVWTPTLEFRVVAASPEGDKTTMADSWPLEMNGQSITRTVFSSADLCQAGGSNSELPQSAQGDNLWRVSAALLGSDASGTRVRLTSTFDRFAAGAVPPSWSQILTFKEGDELTLETLRATSDGPCHRRNLTMRARVVLRPTTAAAQEARYQADAWLVHTDPTGTERRQRLTLTLDASGPAAFRFDALPFALPQLNSNQGDLEAFIQVKGSLRAKIRPDGNIDLEVTTMRPFGLRHPSDPMAQERPGAQGNKTLVIKPEETIAIDLPLPNGVLSQALTPEARFNVGGGVRAGGAPAATAPQPSTDPVTVKNDVMRIMSGPFFKNHKLQLVLQLHKTRD